MFRLIAALCALMLFAAAPAHAEGRSIIVLDGSGSMWGQIDGRPKLEIAREALAGVLDRLPEGAEVGLMAYGHRSKGECGDIELLVPPGPGTGPAIAEAAANMRFLGKTPLTDAVRLAAQELRSSEEKATVILITDGLETCQADPCALGRELEASGVDFTAHVVGFGLTADEGRQVACLAEETGGLYLEAASLDSLSDALALTVIEDVAPEPVPEPAPAPEPEPQPAPPAENVNPSMHLAEGLGEPALIGDGYFDVFALNPDGTPGERVETLYGQRNGSLPPGPYRVTAHLGAAEASADFTVTADAVATPAVILNAGVVAVQLMAQAGVETGDAGFWELQQDGRTAAFGYGSGTGVVPAGDYTLRATFGAAELTRPFTIAAGEEKTEEVILGTGQLALEVVYAPGVKVEDDAQFVEIFQAAADINGNRKSVAFAYKAAPRFDLSPGDYLVRITLGGTVVDVPASITAGSETRLTADLQAGVAAFDLPGTEGLLQEVLTAKADIAGNRKSMAFSYNATWQTTLPAGDYVVTIAAPEGARELPFTVTAGARTEVRP